MNPFQKRLRKSGFELATFAWWLVSFGTLMALTHLFLKERQMNLKDLTRIQGEIDSAHRDNNLRTFTGGLKKSRAQFKRSLKVQKNPNAYFGKKPKKVEQKFIMDFSAP